MQDPSESHKADSAEKKKQEMLSNGLIMNHLKSLSKSNLRNLLCSQYSRGHPVQPCGQLPSGLSSQQPSQILLNQVQNQFNTNSQNLVGLLVGSQSQQDFQRLQDTQLQQQLLLQRLNSQKSDSKQQCFNKLSNMLTQNNNISQSSLCGGLPRGQGTQHSLHKTPEHNKKINALLSLLHLEKRDSLNQLGRDQHQAEDSHSFKQLLSLHAAQKSYDQGKRDFN